MDTGPVLLGMLLTGAVLFSLPLHLLIKRHLLAAVLAASMTVVAVVTIVSVSIGFFEKELMLGVIPGWTMAFLISYLVWGILSVARRVQSPKAGERI